MSVFSCTHTHRLTVAPAAYLKPLPVGGTDVRHEQQAHGCVSSLQVNANRFQVVKMLVLDGPAILVAHVGEDVCRSLVDFLCHHHHYQCQSIKCARESDDSNECARIINVSYEIEVKISKG